MRAISRATQSNSVLDERTASRRRFSLSKSKARLSGTAIQPGFRSSTFLSAAKPATATTASAGSPNQVAKLRSEGGAPIHTSPLPTKSASVRSTAAARMLKPVHQTVEIMAAETVVNYAFRASFACRSEPPIQRSVLDRLREMLRPNRTRGGKICDRAGNLEDATVGPRTKTKPLDRHLHEGAAGRI